MNEISTNSEKDDVNSANRFDLFDACLEQLNLSPESRKIKKLIPYLKTLTSFMQVLKNDNNNYQELLKQVARIMKHESKKENQLIVRNGERGSQFYVILSGKIAILTLKPAVYYLNDIEYILHLLKLRQNEEMEIIRQCIQQNYRLCPFEDNFDQWIRSMTQSKEYKFGKDILFADNREVRHMVEKTLYHLKKNKDNSNTLSMTAEKYIQLNQLENADNLPEGRKLFQIFNYQLINQMETGQTFGNVALENKSSRRTASLITLQQTELGVIGKAEYNLLIKVVNEKAKKYFYNIIYSYNIYQELSRVIFEKKYYHLFVYKKIERGEKLIAEGEITDNVYFLLKGEFELVSKKNMVEVNALIIRLKKLLLTFKKKHELKNQLIDSKEEEFDEEKENKDLIINKQYHQPEHNKILFEKKPVKLGIIKDRDIIGLIDCVDPKTKVGLITCSCVSYNSEVYAIPQQSFDMINWNEDLIRPDLRQFQEKKIDYLIQRLFNHKDLILSEIAKIDLDVTKSQKKETDMQKSRTFKNRLYDLEAHSIFTSKQNISSPHINTQIFPIILSAIKEDIAYNDLKTNTNRFKKIKIKDSKSSHSRNKKQCMYIQDYRTNIVQENLYNNLFHSYLKAEFKKTAEFNFVHSYIGQQVSSKNFIHTKKSYKNKHQKTKTSVNMIDCLIFDKFNKCYSTALRNMIFENNKKG